MSTRLGKTARRGVAYARVSRRNGREGDTFISVDLQEDRTDELAQRYGVKLVVPLIEDIDKTGRNLKRPGLEQAIQLIEEGKADTLIVAKLSRLARNAMHARDALARIEKAGGSLVVGDFGMDTSTPGGKMLFTILAAVAEWEVEVLSEQWAVITERATRNGIKIGPAPIGYRKEVSRRLIPDETTRHLIPELFDRRAGGQSWGQLRDWWHGETGEWLKNGRLGTMIKNRVYLGELHYGPALVIEHNHEPLVTEEQWQAAQSTEAPRRPRSTGKGSLLAGILICSGCERPMTASGGSRGKLVYRCQKNALAGRKCEHPVAVQCDRTDAYVVEQFLAWAGKTTGETTGDADQLKAADRAVANAEAELDAYLDSVSAVVSPARARAGAEKRQAAIDAALAARETLLAGRKVAGVRHAVSERWDELEVMEKRQLLAAGIESVIVAPTGAPGVGYGPRVPAGDRLTITWRED